MFDRDDYVFQWADIGDISEGRPNLGATTMVAVYRLLQFSLRSVLVSELGAGKANDVFFKAGALAGSEFCKNVLDRTLEFSAFVGDLQQKLKNLNIGILRVEEADLDRLSLVLTVSEDLDCSGLPVGGDTVCDYDEGFIAGVLEAYTGKTFNVKEVDCWTTGGRVCRFSAQALQD